FINNESLGGSYLLSPKPDGALIMPMNWAVEHDGVAGQVQHFNLTYALTVAVTAGTHTVTPEVSGPGGRQSFYNANNLNDLVEPNGGVIGASSPESPAHTSPSGDK